MKKLPRILKLFIILICIILSSKLQICSAQIVKLVNKTITLKVLLVEFQDVKHRNPEYPANLALPAYTYNDFENLFFSENKYISPNMYSPDGKEVFGSLRDYYKIMSNNNLEINGFILNKDVNNDNIPDWITLDSSKIFYHYKNGDQFRKEAKNKARAEGLDIDTNGDTFLAIIYAGHTYRAWGNTLNPSAHIDDHHYIMGERFALCFPYEEERNDPSAHGVSHFAHVGIHAHEFGHLLGFPDLLGGFDNKQWSLMSSGNFNGPNNEGACPAPINPYYRWKCGWISVNTINNNSSIILNYNLVNPDIYFLDDKSSKSYFIIEYRNFNSTSKLGAIYFKDFNSCIKNNKEKFGVLVWRKLKGDVVKLLHSCGEICLTGEHFMFPGEFDVKVLSPWSDIRRANFGYYWIPNTKPSTNCAIEIRSLNENHCVVDLLQINPEKTSPSNPKNLIFGNDHNIRLEWTNNLEPDLSYYMIYKKINDGEYAVYDTTSYNYYTDVVETPSQTNDKDNYVYYKITSFDSENKESTYSREIKSLVAPSLSTKMVRTGKTNEIFFLEQNYPNPFNPSTIIRYSVPERARVSLKVYDVLGNEITTLVDKIQSAGSYEVEFELAECEINLASGIYLFIMRANNFVDVKKGLLLK